MPSEYTVQTVVKDEEWDGRDNQLMRTSELVLEGSPNRTWKLTGQAKYKAPSEGDTLFGELDEQKGKFIPRRRQNGDQPSSPAGSGGSKEGPSEEYWAERNRSIVRQHSQEMALRFFAAVRGEQQPFPLDNRDAVGIALNTRLLPIIDWFEKDAAREPAPPARADEDIPF